MCERLRDGNFKGSRTKKIGVLLKTQSWFPTSVKSFMPHPRGSRTLSADPFSGPTVDILSKTGVSFPIPFKNAAEVMFEISCVTTNFP